MLTSQPRLPLISGEAMATSHRVTRHRNETEIEIPAGSRRADVRSKALVVTGIRYCDTFLIQFELQCNDPLTRGRVA